MYKYTGHTYIYIHILFCICSAYYCAYSFHIILICPCLGQNRGDSIGCFLQVYIYIYICMCMRVRRKWEPGRTKCGQAGSLQLVLGPGLALRAPKHVTSYRDI